MIVLFSGVGGAHLGEGKIKHSKELLMEGIYRFEAWPVTSDLGCVVILA